MRQPRLQPALPLLPPKRQCVRAFAPEPQAAGHRVVERLSHGSRPVREAAPRRGLTGYVETGQPCWRGMRGLALSMHCPSTQPHEGTDAMKKYVANANSAIRDVRSRFGSPRFV
jgi:hypothetical protein